MVLSTASKSKKTPSLEFVFLLGAAFILSYIPILNIPFTWMMTFFHEISHGIAALLTGGSVVNIELNLTGSGVCYTRGGSRFVILQAGYMGAVLWGIALYQLAGNWGQKYSKAFALFLAGLVSLTALLYGRDVITWFILLILFALFISIIKLGKSALMRLSLKFVGVYVLLDAMHAPLNLLDGRHRGDGAALSDLTGIPEIIWVALWLTFGLAGIVYLWRNSGRAAQ